MNVAEQYPPSTGTNGITWYRPAFKGDAPPKMWGWTSDPAQAHLDYNAGIPNPDIIVGPPEFWDVRSGTGPPADTSWYDTLPTHCFGPSHDPRCKGECTVDGRDGKIMDPDCFR